MMSGSIEKSDDCVAVFAFQKTRLKQACRYLRGNPVGDAGASLSRTDDSTLRGM
jgi:hypothetical protein